MTVVEAQADRPEEAAAATPEFEKAANRAASRRGFLLALPAYAYLVLFFAVPLGIVLIYSFATRNRFGGTDLSGWNLAAYRKLGEPIVRDILFRSLWLALLTTLICLVFAYPFAYFIATRRPLVRNLMLVFVMIPFLDELLGAQLRLAGAVGQRRAVHQHLRGHRAGGERVAVHLDRGGDRAGLRLLAVHDPASVRVNRADRPQPGRGQPRPLRVGLPDVPPGSVPPVAARRDRAGSILVFVPSLGAYVTPEILGGAKTTLLGSYIVTQFLTARNWPVGASLSFVLMSVMLVATLVYFRSGGRNL